ncbi:MAG: adenylate/guanylate cyclase domain-containing protein [Flavobacteriales bacterium]|nr:adenylate/guanylate cyclase domain-containing protein [Flavobacteriales bacterium]
MDPYTRVRTRTMRTLRIAAAWALIGLFRALLEHNLLIHHGLNSSLLDRGTEELIAALLAGFFGGGVYIFLLRDKLRHVPYFAALSIVASMILLVVMITGALVPSIGDPMGGSFKDRLLSLPWLAEYLYWACLMASTMLIVRLSDQYGNDAFGYLIGRYHKPRQELRIFMFLDMRSSTSIAEELGHVRYFKLLNELFTDITDPILYSRGDIYQYVGDEISVSWPLRQGISRQRCIRCFLDIRAKLQRRGPYYKERYGIAPAFKAGFHYGEVTVGEVGLMKKERIFSGDVVNTAARIQDTCNEYGVDNLISKELLDLLQPLGKLKVRGIGSIALRGKRSTMSLWTLEPESPATAVHALDAS